MTGPHRRLLVCTAAEAAAVDRETIAAGVPSRALMQRAGAAAASEIARRFPEGRTRGALVLAGPGNNGGDGWVVARALAASGWPVRVWESEPARTPDAQAERALAVAAGIPAADRPRPDGEGVVVDALLGTGATGRPRPAIAAGIAAAVHAASHGAAIVALDVPSGVDATTGAVPDRVGDVVRAALTLTFGTLKRGHLVARAHCGQVVVLDIGLVAAANEAALPTLLTHRDAYALLAPVSPDAHKGTKRHVAIVGGAPGMAGAAILAARGALRAGAGLVKVLAHPESADAIRSAVPQALTSTWDDAPQLASLAEWAHAIAIGPGLGVSGASRAMLMDLLANGDVPVVLDADALNMFPGDAAALRAALHGRLAVLTPHPAEMMRLAGAASVADVLSGRFDIGAAYAQASGATVLLKGVPTIVSAPDGRRVVTATGTPALATGGSGDVLTGMVATLLAQLGDPLEAAAGAAWAHGRAAEIATVRAGTARGVSLDEVLADVANAAWAEVVAPAVYPVLFELA